jgi:glycosyltransferase involved in cell wall biosynthesis
MLGKPVVMTCLGLFGAAWIQMRGPVLGRAWLAWERFLIRRPFDRVFFLSDYSLSEGLRIGARRERCALNEPGVESEKFPASEKRSGVLFVGKLDVRKGIEDVLAVAAALPHIPFVVIGWGQDSERYWSAAPSNVTFEEVPPPDELWRRFSQASIFFLPSYAETFGMAILQAMAGGCAIVSSIPLPFEGRRVAPGDRGAMIHAIQELNEDAAGRKRMGGRNRQIASKYTWERFCGNLEDAYTRVLEKRRSALQ